MKKSIFFSIIVFALIVSLVGCSRPPDDSVIENLIKKSLKIEVKPSVMENLLGGWNADVEEFEILNKTHEKDEPNPLLATLGAKPQSYWLVEVRVKGSATLGGNDIASSSFANPSKLKKNFNAIMKYKLFQKEDGSWYAKNASQL